MKWQSAKQAAAYREHRPARDAFLADMRYSCAVCGTSTYVVHEITPGKNRMRAFGVRAAWLAACDYHNCSEFPDRTKWPLCKQLALKLLTDPKHFDLIEIRRIFAVEGTPVDRLPVVVTEGEVLEAVRCLMVERCGG